MNTHNPPPTTATVFTCSAMLMFLRSRSIATGLFTSLFMRNNAPVQSIIFKNDKITTLLFPTVKCLTRQIFIPDKFNAVQTQQAHHSELDVYWQLMRIRPFATSCSTASVLPAWKKWKLAMK